MTRMAKPVMGGEVHGPDYPAPLWPDIYHPPGWWERAQAHKEGVRGAAPSLRII